MSLTLPPQSNLNGPPWCVHNFETSGTLASLTLPAAIFDPAVAVVLGVDCAVSGFVPNTLVAQWGFTDGSVVWADAQTFEAGNTSAQWRGQLLVPHDLGLVVSANTTASVHVSVFVWGIITSWRESDFIA